MAEEGPWLAPRDLGRRSRPAGHSDWTLTGREGALDQKPGALLVFSEVWLGAVQLLDVLADRAKFELEETSLEFATSGKVSQAA